MTKEFAFARKRASKTPIRRESENNWRLLVVDDDDEVHAVTRIALRQLSYRDRGIEILHAHSAAEARQILENESDIALVLLDVVMESDHAGLALARAIREELENNEVRIVLRTGQPGHAPEESVVLEYDINDYRTKTELTAQRLFTTVITALRGYDNIITLEHNRRGLERIIRELDLFPEVRSKRPFASAVLAQLAGFLGTGSTGVMCVYRDAQDISDLNDFRILATSGAFDELPLEQDKHPPLSEALIPEDVKTAVAECARRRTNIFHEGIVAIFLDSREGGEFVACLLDAPPLSKREEPLLDLFCNNIAGAFRNHTLFERLREAKLSLERRVEERTIELEHANRDLERLAMTDSLTGVDNRRNFFRRSERLLNLASRYGHTACVAMIDADNFKVVNDTYGHHGGDDVLRVLTKTALAQLRKTDIFGRLGGEEFAVMMPETGIEQGQLVCERIRAAIEATPVVFENEVAHVTVSIGLVELRRGDELAELLKFADIAVYAAKRRGRNCVEIYDETTQLETVSWGR